MPFGSGPTWVHLPVEEVSRRERCNSLKRPLTLSLSHRERERVRLHHGERQRKSLSLQENPSVCDR
jgi:hypothetical protein